MTLAEFWDLIVGRPLTVVGLLLLGLVVRWLLFRLVDRAVRRGEEGVLPDRLSHLGMDSTRRVQRARTVGSLLKSIISGITVAVISTMILSEFVDIAPIVASAGILGVALGFGAQSLVKDFLSGIFMIFEDQYGVGDVVDAGEAIGTVEAVGLRVTRLRDLDGTVWYIRNGEIVRIGNKSQNWARSVLDIGVAYSEDLTRVRRILEEVAHGLWDDEEFRDVVIEEPEVWGVEDLAADAVTMRVTLKTAPLQQWRVARVMRERIKARFDHEGIEIPFPQRVVWQRQDGEAAPEAGDGADA
jgi:small conductance mechanosensitive channel